MQSFIELENIRFTAYHGVMPQEKIVGNSYEVNLLIKGDFIEASQTDNLEKTINYAELYEIIKAEMMIPSELIEHVAGRIINSIKANYPELDEIRVKVSKLNPPISGEVEKASVILQYKK